MTRRNAIKFVFSDGLIPQYNLTLKFSDRSDPGVRYGLGRQAKRMEPLMKLRRTNDGALAIASGSTARWCQDAVDELAQLACYLYTKRQNRQRLSIPEDMDRIFSDLAPIMRIYTPLLNIMATDKVWPMFWALLTGGNRDIIAYSKDNAAENIKRFRETYGLSKSDWKTLVNTNPVILYWSFTLNARYDIPVVAFKDADDLLISSNFSTIIARIDDHDAGRKNIHEWMKRKNINRVDGQTYSDLVSLADDIAARSTWLVNGVTYTETRSYEPYRANTISQLSRALREAEARPEVTVLGDNGQSMILNTSGNGQVFFDEAAQFAGFDMGNAAGDSLGIGYIHPLSREITDLFPTDHDSEAISKLLQKTEKIMHRNFNDLIPVARTIRPITPTNPLWREMRDMMDESRTAISDSFKVSFGEVPNARSFCQHVVTAEYPHNPMNRPSFTLDAVREMSNAFHEAGIERESRIAWGALERIARFGVNIGPAINGDTIPHLATLPRKKEIPLPQIYTIIKARLLHSTEAVLQEGEKMLHCLGRTYMPRILKGQYVAYHLDVRFLDESALLSRGMNGIFHDGIDLIKCIREHGITIGFHFFPNGDAMESTDKPLLRFDQMHSYKNENIPQFIGQTIQNILSLSLRKDMRPLTESTATDKITAEKEKHYAAMAISNA